MNLKFKLLNKTDKPLNGIVSVACVSDDRIETARQTDIESYVYLVSQLGNLPVYPVGRGYDSKEYLEDVLLVKGWRRYTWQQMLKVSAADTTPVYSTAIFTGNIKKGGKALKEPMPFVLLRDSSSRLVSTDSTGYFELSPEQLVTNWGKNVNIFANTEDAGKNGYAISIIDPYELINEKLAREKVFENQDNGLMMLSTKDQHLKGMEHTTMLKEVVIKAGKDGSSIFKMAGSNECGDYVCPYHILNCPNHYNSPNITRPIIGELYYTDPSLIQKLPYTGCAVLPKIKFFTLKGIYMSKEFYPSDYAQYNPSQPEYLSTIFWKHSTRVNSTGEVNLNFYTSDVTGRFRVIIQGIAGDDVVFGESTFTVKKH